MASCREYVQEQTANRKAHTGREGATSSHNSPSENSTANGLYSKGCVEARKEYSVFFHPLVCYLQAFRQQEVAVLSVCALVSRLVKRLDFDSGHKLLL